MEKIIDLSHAFSEDISVFPGSPKPIIHQKSTIEKDGYAEIKYTFCTHHGTHIDAPCHMLSNTKSLDAFPISKFIGPAYVLDCSKSTSIDLVDLQAIEEEIKKSEFLLFYTGWQHKWGTEAYFEPYPVLSKAACEWISQFKLKAIGFDVLSPDPIASTELVNHKILFRKEILIVENLNNLDLLIGKHFSFQCLPLHLRNADGGPVRAIAIL